MRIVVAVVRGGPSGEHEPSLQTGKAVLDALDKEKYESVDVIIDRKGEWHRDDVVLPPEEALAGVDLVFSALHGVYGEDGVVQRIYEALGVRHTGSEAIAAGRAFDKEYTKHLAQEHGIKVPRHAVVSQNADVEDKADEILKTFSFPLIVKPAMGGSSLGVTLADSHETLVSGLHTALEGGQHALVEEFIHGKEATVGVVERFRDEELCALPPLEITLAPGHSLYDFEAKYAPGESTEKVGGSLTKEEQRILADAARTMHRALGLAHYSRSDFRVNERGVHYLETNSKPSLAGDDLFPQAFAAAGHSSRYLAEHVITLAREQKAWGAARPPKPRYVKYYVRTLSVIECELWQRAERIELPALNERRHFFHPLFSFTPGKGTSVYYNMADGRQDPRAMAYYFNDNRQEFLEILQESRRYFSLLDTMLNSRSASFPGLFHFLAKAWPGIALANTLASECRELVDDAVSDAALRLFAENEEKAYAVEKRMREWMSHNLPRRIRPYLSVVKFDEVMSMQFPERWELEARLKGFVFFRGRLFAASLRDIARRYGLVIAAEKQQFTGDLRGMSVRPGCVRGRVRVLFESTQLDKIQDGEVLVTSMTTPDLLPAVRRAIAFVTDEGNITCDAAVLARGERKPFVTGTGYATEYLKDGDMVEVDADAGVVRVLERFS